jgi:hypothetical protein
VSSAAKSSLTRKKNNLKTGFTFLNQRICMLCNSKEAEAGAASIFLPGAEATRK